MLQKGRIKILHFWSRVTLSPYILRMTRWEVVKLAQAEEKLQHIIIANTHYCTCCNGEDQQHAATPLHCLHHRDDPGQPRSSHNTSTRNCGGSGGKQKQGDGKLVDSASLRLQWSWCCFLTSTFDFPWVSVVLCSWFLFVPPSLVMKSRNLRWVLISQSR